MVIGIRIDTGATIDDGETLGLDQTRYLISEECWKILITEGHLQ
jgi:hypothetical protein